MSAKIISATLTAVNIDASHNVIVKFFLLQDEIKIYEKDIKQSDINATFNTSKLPKVFKATSSLSI